jgi:multidrug efflux pump subunit AcrA (membrane-fusion protein)
MMKKIFYCFLAFAVVSCGKKDAQPGDAHDSGAPTVEVQTAPVEIGTIQNVLRVTGKTQALHQEKVFTPIAGKITALNVIEGNPVKSGEVLATIRTEESEAALTGAQTAVASATTPQQKSDAERALKIAQQSANEIAVRAPFAGIVANRALNGGEFVSDHTELLTLVDLSSLYFLADVPAASLAQIKTGDDADIIFPGFPGKIFHAKIDNVNPQVDAASQMAKVRLKFSGEFNELRSDMFGEARIVIGEHRSAVLVPRAAVMLDNETNIHTVALAEDSIARVVEVKTGLADSARTEILSPHFDAGTKVITVGNYGLQDSTKIIITQTEK